MTGLMRYHAGHADEIQGLTVPINGLYQAQTLHELIGRPPLGPLPAGLFDSGSGRRSEKEESFSIFHIIIWVLPFLCIRGGNDGVEEGEKNEIRAIILKPSC